MMDPREFALIRERDGHRCARCGMGGATLVPNHRANRGMGGSRSKDHPANIITLCSHCNGIIEADPLARAEAVASGWKLELGDDPYETPCYDNTLDTWFRLDDEYGRNIVHPTDLPERFRP